MTDEEIRVRYNQLLQDAITAFRVDASYAEDIVKKARVIYARREKRQV